MYGPAPKAARDAMPTREQIDGMEWTLSVLKEALRKYSIVPVVTRNLTQVSSVCGGGWCGCGWVLKEAQVPHRACLSLVATCPRC